MSAIERAVRQIRGKAREGIATALLLASSVAPEQKQENVDSAALDALNTRPNITEVVQNPNALQGYDDRQPWRVEARPVHEGKHLEREDLSQITKIFPVSIEDGTVFPLIEIHDSSPYHEELTRLQEHLEVALRGINITPEDVQIFIPARRIKEKPEPLVHMPPILTEDSSSKKDAEVQIVPTIHPTEKGKITIEAFSMVYGKQNKRPVTLGLLLTPKARSDGWNFIISQAKNLYKSAYGQEDNNDRNIIAVPSPKEKKVLAFEYTEPDIPLRLVSIGIPDKKGEKIIWHSARREIVAGQPLTVMSNNPRMTIIDIDQERIELVYNALARLPKEDRGSFTIPKRPVRWEINLATRSRYPLKKDELNPRNIILFAYGPAGQDKTVIHMSRSFDPDGTVVYTIHPTEKWLQQFDYPDPTVNKNRLNSHLGSNIYLNIGLTHGIFGLNPRTQDGVSDGRIRRLGDYLRDNGFDFEGLFSVEYNPKLR